MILIRQQRIRQPDDAFDDSLVSQIDVFVHEIVDFFDTLCRGEPNLGGETFQGKESIRDKPGNKTENNPAEES